MLNSFSLCGMIDGCAEKSRTSAEFYLIVERNFREENGLRNSDRFRIKIWRGMADEINSIVEDGTLAAVKGRMKVENGEIVLIAEQVSVDRRKMTE